MMKLNKKKYSRVFQMIKDQIDGFSKIHGYGSLTGCTLTLSGLVHFSHKVIRIYSEVEYFFEELLCDVMDIHFSVYVKTGNISDNIAYLIVRNTKKELNGKTIFDLIDSSVKTLRNKNVFDNNTIKFDDLLALYKLAGLDNLLTDTSRSVQLNSYLPFLNNLRCDFAHKSLVNFTKIEYNLKTIESYMIDLLVIMKDIYTQMGGKI